MLFRKLLLPQIAQQRHVSALIKTDGKPPRYFSSVESGLSNFILLRFWGYISMLHSHQKIHHRWMWKFIITLFWLMEQNGITQKFQGNSGALSQQLTLDYFILILLNMRSRLFTGVSEFSAARLLMHLPCTLNKWSGVSFSYRARTSKKMRKCHTVEVIASGKGGQRAVYCFV